MSAAAIAPRTFFPGCSGGGVVASKWRGALLWRCCSWRSLLQLLLAPTCISDPEQVLCLVNYLLLVEFDFSGVVSLYCLDSTFIFQGGLLTGIWPVWYLRHRFQFDICLHHLYELHLSCWIKFPLIGDFSLRFDWTKIPHDPCLAPLLHPGPNSGLWTCLHKF